jgi:hypothetical protein
MSQSLTKQQLFILMKLVYLGNWIANAFRDKQIKEYEEGEDLIFKMAKFYGFDRFVDHEEKDGNHYYPTSYFEHETDVMELIEKYDGECFWDELIHRMAERDFYKIYTKDRIEKMSREKYFEKLGKLEDKYSEEFYKYGLKNLEVEKVKK